ncbi:MAG: hypothetical protein AAB360_03320 [Patescibacteria group bacterium]
MFSRNDLPKIKAIVAKHPESLRTLIPLLQSSALPIDDRELDEVFGFDFNRAAHGNPLDLIGQFGHEQFTYEATPYDYIREFLRTTKPAAQDVIYDLGAGLGRVLTYCSLATEAKCIGIEIVPERVARQLKISNLHYLCGNVLDFDLSCGTIFFLFNSFHPETLIKVTKRLKKIARDKKISIAAWGGPTERYFAKQEWLGEAENKKSSSAKLHFFRSI